jgi:hypothetical protein
VLLQLGLEALEQGEGVGRGTREAGEDAVLVQAPDLARGGLDDDVAEGHLAVAAHGDAFAAAHGEDGGAVESWGFGIQVSAPGAAICFSKVRAFRPHGEIAV